MLEGIFTDAEIEADFQRDGYVVIDFISAEDARLIAKKFYEIHTSIPDGFYADAFSPDDKIKEEIYKHTDDVFQKALEGRFHNHKKLGSTFLCKAPGEKGRVGVHQDWSVVDESRYYSATIWVPTTDTNEDNGTLKVIPGSHKFFSAHRSNNIPTSYRGSEILLWENMVTVPMKAGQAFILNHAVIHASAANTTDKERLVIAYALTHKEAPLSYYHQERNSKHNTVERYIMPDDFFQRYYNVGERPLFGRLAEVFEYRVPAVEHSTIEALLKDSKKLRA